MKVLTTFNHLGELGNEFLCGNCVFYWGAWCRRYPKAVEKGESNFCGEYWPAKAYLKELEG